MKTPSIENEIVLSFQGELAFPLSKLLKFFLKHLYLMSKKVKATQVLMLQLESCSIHRRQISYLVSLMFPFFYSERPSQAAAVPCITLKHWLS